jgi:hypothetical protein
LIVSWRKLDRRKLDRRKLDRRKLDRRKLDRRKLDRLPSQAHLGHLRTPLRPQLPAREFAAADRSTPAITGPPPQ